MAARSRLRLADVMMLVGFFGVSACVPVIVPEDNRSIHTVVTGRIAPEIGGEFVMGAGPQTLAAAHGHVVVIDFWATYCDPCKRSFPIYQQLMNRFKGKLDVIAISLDEVEGGNFGLIKKFVNDAKVSFPILWDKDRSASNSYHPPHLPTAYIIDKKSIVRYVHTKYEDGDGEKMASEIGYLVEE